MGKILDGFDVEVYIKSKRSLRTAPITEMGKHPNPYAIFTPNYIKALEKVVKDAFLEEMGKNILTEHLGDKIDSE